MSSIASSPVAHTNARSGGRGRFARIGLITVVAAVVANVLVYFLGGVIVPYDPQFLILANVSGAVIFTIVPAIVAVLLYAALLRFTRNPARIFTIIAAVILVVTAIPDLTYIPSVPGSTNAQIAVLLVMHLVAAAVIVGILTTAARPRPR